MATLTPRCFRTRFLTLATCAFAAALSLFAPNQAIAAEGDVAKIGEKTYATLQDAVDDAQDGATITLIDDVVLTEAAPNDRRYCLSIKDKSLTIDGKGKQSITPKLGRGIYVYGGDSADSLKTVTFKGVKVISGGDQAIASRGGHLNLNIVDSQITLTGSGNMQAVVMGGSHDWLNKLVIENSTITANSTGYGVVTYNPTDLTVANSNISGYAALYFKGPDGSAGSTGTNALVKAGSVLENNNLNGGDQDEFGTIVISTSGVSVVVNDSKVITHSHPNAKQNAFEVRADSTVKVTGMSTISLTDSNSSLVDEPSKDIPNPVIIESGSINRPVNNRYLAESALLFSENKGTFTIEPKNKVLAKANAVVEKDGTVVYYPTKEEAEQQNPDATITPSYKVTFDSAGGTSIDPTFVFVDENGKITKPSVDPTRVGHSFTGWTVDGKAWDFSTDKVSKPMTLTASWKADVHTVTFDDCLKETENSVVNISYGSKVTRPVDPTCKGYTFLGWFSDTALTKPFDFESPITGDIVLYAKWEADKPVADPEQKPESKPEQTPANKLPQTGDPAAIMGAILPVATIALTGGMAIRRNKR